MSKWILLAIVSVSMMSGCTEPSTMHERQDAALRDPFDYSPYDGAKPDSGAVQPKKSGSISRDVNSVFNP